MCHDDDAGIPRDAIDFFTELEDHNDRTWWAANSARYRTIVREPFERMLGELDDDLEWRIYRPHRDVRFSADRRPYKSFIGAVAQRPSGNGHFVQISRRGLLVASGYPMMAKDQLARFRAAIDDERTGPRFLAAVALAEAAGITVTTGRHDPLGTAPRGYPRDHPRVHWLRAKGVELPHRAGAPSWLHTDAAASHVRDLLAEGGAVVEWLDAHVGPSDLSPEEIWRR